MSLAVRVIPCLDVDAGRVVKGVNFVDLRDAGDPVEMARVYDAEGADELTFLDITASSGDRETTYDVVRRTAESVFIPLTVGGGVRSVTDVDRLLRAGADKVAVNTAAVARRASTDSATTWLQNRSAISATSSGRAIAAVLTATLSAPARSSRSTSSTEETPPPTVSGMKTSSAVRDTISIVVARPSWEAEMSRKVSSSAPSAS